MKKLIRTCSLLILLLVGSAGAEARFDPLQRAASVRPAGSTLTHLPAPDGDEELRGAGGGSPATSYLLQSQALRAARSLGYLVFPAAAPPGLGLGPTSLPLPSAYLQGNVEVLPVIFTILRNARP